MNVRKSSSTRAGHEHCLHSPESAIGHGAPQPSSRYQRFAATAAGTIRRLPSNSSRRSLYDHFMRRTTKVGQRWTIQNPLRSKEFSTHPTSTNHRETNPQVVGSSPTGPTTVTWPITFRANYESRFRWQMGRNAAGKLLFCVLATRGTRRAAASVALGATSGSTPA